MNQPRYNSLDDALESVPREAQPTRDLWPGIVQALGERRDPSAVTTTNLGEVRAARSARAPRVQWPMALAASLGVVCLVGALCWSVIRQRGVSDLTARSARRRSRAARR